MSGHKIVNELKLVHCKSCTV